jgi:hypothetical protein
LCKAPQIEAPTAGPLILPRKNHNKNATATSAKRSNYEQRFVIGAGELINFGFLLSCCWAHHVPRKTYFLAELKRKYATIFTLSSRNVQNVVLSVQHTTISSISVSNAPVKFTAPCGKSLPLSGNYRMETPRLTYFG